MAQKKISELTSTASVKDHNIFPLVQDGVTKHIKYSDLKAPLVKEVEANVEDYVDDKLKNKANYGYTTMVDLGFTKNSTVSVRDFWAKLHSKFGTSGVIQFTWNYAASANLGNSSVSINGGTLVYTASSIPSAWQSFSAIYYNASGVYNIRCSFEGDTSKDAEKWSVNKLANNADILSVRSDLSDVSEKLEYTRNYYTDANSTIGRAIGRWHDGRRVWRVVYLAKDLTATSAYANGGTVYGFTGGLTKQRHVDFFFSAKIHWKNGATLQDVDILLANDDCIFTTGAVNTSVSTENVDCLVVEFVEK